jgi:flagellar motor switch protein FliN
MSQPLPKQELPSAEKVSATPHISVPDIRPSQDGLRTFRGVPVDISIELGRGILRLRDLLRLRYHSVFTLDKPAGASLDLYVNGILLGRGEPVFKEDRVGIRINEIVEPDR